MSNWSAEEFRALPLEAIDVRYGRYRLSLLEAEETMARSLRRYGQIAPVVVCLREEVPVLVDGFKRLAAARGLKGFSSLSARRIEVDERGAKAAMYGLNRTGRHFGELEEAWLVQAMVREDGLSQVEVAVLLGRHKSWVCRRLAMLEKLATAAREDLRLGRAVQFLVDNAVPISMEQAEARERLWTPEEEKAPSGAKLWTPGDAK